MQLNPKSIGLLSLLVVSIYVMRDGGLSFTTPVSRTVFRRLYDYARPDSTTCSGVSLTETFSEGDLNRAKNLQESLKSVRGGNPLEEVLMGGKVDGDKFLDYAMGMIASVAVWAAFFVLSIICCCCGCCNWCCMFGCCKGCKCCKCCKKPQTAGKKKKVYAIVSLVFMLALFSAGIAGAAFSGSIPNGMKVSYCAILSMVEDLAYGRQADKWLGLKGVIVSLGDILVSFDTTINGLSTTSSSSFTNMNNAYTTASQAVTDYYNNHNALTLTRPDPAQSSSSSYKPDWVNNLGPIATSGKYLYAIQQEMDVKRDTLNNAQTDINNAITDVKTQQADIKSSLQSGRDSANDIFASVEDAIKSLNDAGDLVNTIVQIIGKVILAIFIVYIVIALLPIISILLIHFLKIKFFSKIMHFSWCIMGFLAIIGFLICAIFYPISIIFTEFCGVFTNALTDGAYFNQTIGSAMGDGQAKDLTYLCMFGNGAALEQLGVNDSVSHFDTIYTQLDEVNKTLNFSSPNPVPSTTIPYAKWLLESFRDGYMPDSTTLTDDLATLNALTNKNSNGCTPNQDTWITSTVNCTTSEGANFTSSSAATYDQPNPSCIGMDVWASGSGNSGSNRYTLTQFPSSCATKNGGQTQLAYVQQFADNLKTQRTASKTLFTNLLTDFTATGGIEDAEADFGGYAYDCLSPFSTIKAQLSGIEASLTGPESGVIPNTRCQFIGTGMKTFANALCIGFVASIYQATVVLIIVSMFSFFGAICVMCAAKRINVDDKDGDKHVAPDAYHEGKMVN